MIHKPPVLFILFILTVSILELDAQTIWNGPKITFTKPTGSSFKLASNQDRITSSIWITRDVKAGIFNIKQSTDSIYKKNLSPIDTEWAFGTTIDLGTLTFTSWEESFGGPPDEGGGGPISTLNKDMVVHLITDDIYIDIKFLSWDFSNGGGFSYERSTDNTLKNEEKHLEKNIKIHPNPTSHFITVQNLSKAEYCKIYSSLGVKVFESYLSNNQNIDFSEFPQGIYLVSFKEKNEAIKVVKH